MGRYIVLDKAIECVDRLVLETGYDNEKVVEALNDIPLSNVIEIDSIAKVLESIKAEINDLDYMIDDAKYSDTETRVHNVDCLIDEIMEIIDNHINGIVKSSR